MQRSPATPNPPRGLDSFGDWFSDIFKLWGAQWQTWVLQGLIYCCIVFVPIAILYFGFIVSVVATTPSNSSAGPPPVVFVMMPLIFLWVLLAPSLLMPGMINTALMQIRGAPISAGDLFSGTRYFGLYFLYMLVIQIGACFCIIPGFAFMGLFALCIPIAIDQRVSATEALSRSWNVVKGNFWMYLLFMLVAQFLSGAGSMACYIGLIATIPFQAIAIAVAYQRTYYGSPTAPPQAPPSMNGPLPPPFTPTNMPPVPPTYQAPVPPTYQASATPQPVDPSVCAQCGSRLPDGALQCPHCGTPRGLKAPGS
jgi:ribosomal protein L40E